VTAAAKQRTNDIKQSLTQLLSSAKSMGWWHGLKGSSCH